MKKFVICLFPVLFFLSCKPYPEDVREALELSYTNRPELEKVLAHYRKTDRKKFKAACFLIANMPYHKTKNELKLQDFYYRYFEEIDSLFNEFFGDMNDRNSKGMEFMISSLLGSGKTPHEKKRTTSENSL